ASGGKAVECTAQRCAASFSYGGESGRRNVIVQYFDVNNGVARFRLLVGKQLVAEWSADDQVPTRKVDGASSTRRVISVLALRAGDEIRIEAIPDGGETAALDYVEIEPSEN